jgi:hypothetical protein
MTAGRLAVAATALLLGVVLVGAITWLFVGGGRIDAGNAGNPSFGLVGPAGTESP